MFPIKNEDKCSGIPFVTALIMLLCAVVFVLQDSVIFDRGLVPLDFVHKILYPHTGVLKAAQMLVFSFFMHGGIVHLASNLWYLWIFGSAMEHRIGYKTFALVYLICGIASMVIQVVSSPLSVVPIVGASGAIAGIMGLHLVYGPFFKILVWIPPVFFLRIPAFIFLLMWFWLQYINLGSVQTGGGGIAWWAHVGGYLGGFGCAVILRFKGVGVKRKALVK